MKEWALTCLAAGIFCGIGEWLIPEKEGGACRKSFRFLAALVLLVLIFSPLLNLFSGKITWKTGGLSSSAGTKWDAELLWREMAQDALNGIRDSLQKSFPDYSFRLEAVTGEKGEITEIHVYAKTSLQAETLCAKIKKVYGIPAEYKGGLE